MEISIVCARELEELQKENERLKELLKPKEPVWIYDDEPLCPNCNEVLTNESQCGCGQCIDWSNS